MEMFETVLNLKQRHNEAWGAQNLLFGVFIVLDLQMWLWNIKYSKQWIETLPDFQSPMT